MEHERSRKAAKEKQFGRWVRRTAVFTLGAEGFLFLGFLAALYGMKERAMLIGSLYGILTLAVFLSGYFQVAAKVNRTLGLVDDTIDALIGGGWAEHFPAEADDLLGKFQDRIGKLYEILNAHKLREQKLREELSSLVADLVHQINTPLTNLKLYASFLEEDLERETRREFLEHMKEQVERLQWFGEGFDKVARLETDLIRLEHRVQPVLPLVLWAVDQVALKAAARGLTVALKGEQKAEAFCDRKWTQEALFNLLDNGVKYAVRKGELTVRITPMELYLRIDVEDVSAPIQKEEYPRLFQRFYRGRNAAMVQEGVGLGLFLARQILEEEGGYIQVEPGPEGGNRFSLFLKMW